MKHYDYSMFTEFINKYEASGFRDIQRTDPFIQELEKKLEQNKQFFYIADIIRFDIRFISEGIRSLLSMNPEQFDFSIFFDKIHPDDLIRYSLARSKYVKIGQDLLLKQKGSTVFSANFRQLDPTGKYVNLLFQGYLFYSGHPNDTVYGILLMTDITYLEKGRHAYHFHVGHDPANFRYPDKKLLSLGRDFSQREFDILKLIATGMDSEQIASKLFLSVNTVNTHRRNLLKKTNRSTTHELVIELKESGVL